MSQRIAEAAYPLADYCLKNGKHFAVLTISYREIYAMLRVFGPRIVTQIHLRVVEVLRQELPSHCFVVAAQGGLVLLMQDVNREEAFQLAIRLESILCGSFRIDGFDYGVNFIFSTGEFPGHTTGTDISIAEFHRLFTLYEDENYELYKDTGTRVFSITKERFESLSRVHELDRLMRNDFAAGRFVMHYQPRVELTTGKIVGAEALMRWDSSKDGMISPGVFIPIAEKNGFIHTLTPHAVRSVARDVGRFCAAFGQDFTVGANLSGICIRSPNIVPIIKECLDEFGAPRGSLEIEITESQLIDQRRFVMDRLEELREAGVATALDDFGTGFSSLHVLTHIPLDYLKLDRSFVSLLSDDPTGKHAAIARSISEMGKACGLQVIAEGMETETEVRALIEKVGCPLGQGFFFARPMPLEDFLALPECLPTASKH
ncbi:EAL domain-containing protein [Hwanghaeella grinnelliae]|nr:EAL domain-containing protein [Hwanghaeella grinnelliae]